MFGIDFVDFFFSFVFIDCISPFNICCKAGLVVLNSFNFCLSEKLFIYPSILNEILSGYSNLGCRFFPVSTLNIYCRSLLVCRVSAETVKLLSIWGFPCMLLVAFPLLLLIFFFVCLVFVSLISMYLGVIVLGFIPYGTLCASWTCLVISFSMLGEFSTIISAKVCSHPFFLSSSS